MSDSKLTDEELAKELGSASFDLALWDHTYGDTLSAAARAALLTRALILHLRDNVPEEAREDVLEALAGAARDLMFDPELDKDSRSVVDSVSEGADSTTLLH